MAQLNQRSKNIFTMWDGACYDNELNTKLYCATLDKMLCLIEQHGVKGFIHFCICHYTK